MKYYHFLYIGIGFGIGRYEKYYIGILSVSADKKIEFIGLYLYRPIRKKAYQSPTGHRKKVICKSMFYMELNQLGRSIGNTIK